MHRVFRKNLLIVLAIAALFTTEKWLVIQKEAEYKQDLYRINEWIELCSGIPETQINAYISSLGSDVDEKDAQYSAMKNSRNALYNSFRNQKYVLQLISFARNKEGQIGNTLPANYLQLLDFYAELSEPELINEQPLDLYFSLQAYNIVPILVLLLNVIFWGKHYEEEIHKLTQTSYYGAKYDKSIRNILLLLSVTLFAGNELIDLTISGMLETGHLWTASLQSYSEMKFSQFDGTIGVVLALVWCSKLLNLLLLGTLTEQFARKKKNVKDTAVTAVLILLATVIFEKALEKTQYVSALQIGLVNYQTVINEAAILVPSSVSTFTVGIIILLTVTVASWALLRKNYIGK